MTEIAGRLLFSTIKTSNSKSQNDDEILHYRIYQKQSPFTKIPVSLPARWGVYKRTSEIHRSTQKRTHHFNVFDYKILCNQP